jgi:iron complex outermembrane receptor protein
VETAVGTGGIQGGDIRSFNLTLFNAGAVYNLQQGRELYASFSQGAEITQVGRAATAATRADRVDPQPAKSNQYELGFRQRSRALDYSVAAFYTSSDLMSAVDCNVPTTEPCKPLREPRKFWGIEGTLGWHIDAKWGVGGTLSWMDGIRTLASGAKRRIGSNESPPLLVSTYVDYAPLPGWKNRLTFDFRGSRNPFGSSTAFSEGRVDSVFLAHLSAAFDVGPGELQVGIRNLFDKKYFSIAAESSNAGFNWIPEQGRRVSVSYAVTW